MLKMYFQPIIDVFFDPNMKVHEGGHWMRETTEVWRKNSGHSLSSTGSKLVMLLMFIKNALILRVSLKSH